MQGKHKAPLENVNKMFMVGHIFDRPVGNLKPTIIFIWPYSIALNMAVTI